ncbi:Soluble lytic murein transglycosylase precursor [hydrothermal vent metagenome]|uniref:Soluble lytic murein transglycosylase n=1 Tax=hydrothermal vent metagenome TaxID=652676 RepID=A0A1W1BFR8_9ZZZZ
MRTLLFFITFILLFYTTAEAKTFTYWQIHHMPKSVEKDYYIWRLLLQKSTTKIEAQNIITEASHLNKKLRTAYHQKTGLTAKLPKTITSGPVDNSWRSRSKANKYFKHGIALLQQGKAKQASGYFDVARRTYKKRYDIDKSLFWLYLSTKNRIYLKALHKSYHVNIYTLIAADSMNARYPKTITESLWKSKTFGFDIQDPIDWAKIKLQMKAGCNLDDLADEHKSQECIGIYTYIKAKASKYTETYFPMPYRNIMKKLPKKRQALIYAIARQESRFVPASVSRSFALGMMQFMPFLIEHIAKQKGEKIDLDEIFNPYKAIEYANYHLNYLTKYLHHPLFIAYAYNAGIGFTRRHIKNPKHFRRGAYEPYMSMETMRNFQAREYGKKVLANYVIYMNKLGVKTRLFPLLKILATPKETDRFRK